MPAALADTSRRSSPSPCPPSPAGGCPGQRDVGGGGGGGQAHVVRCRRGRRAVVRGCMVGSRSRGELLRHRRPASWIGVGRGDGAGRASQPGGSSAAAGRRARRRRARRGPSVERRTTRASGHARRGGAGGTRRGDAGGEPVGAERHAADAGAAARSAGGARPRDVARPSSSPARRPVHPDRPRRLVAHRHRRGRARRREKREEDQQRVGDRRRAQQAGNRAEPEPPRPRGAFTPTHAMLSSSPAPSCFRLPSGAPTEQQHRSRRRRAPKPDRPAPRRALGSPAATPEHVEQPPSAIDLGARVGNASRQAPGAVIAITVPTTALNGRAAGSSATACPTGSGSAAPARSAARARRGDLGLGQVAQRDAVDRPSRWRRPSAAIPHADEREQR